jgi:hypothetical protein
MKQESRKNISDLPEENLNIDRSYGAQPCFVRHSRAGGNPDQKAWILTGLPGTHLRCKCSRETKNTPQQVSAGPGTWLTIKKDCTNETLLKYI